MLSALEESPPTRRESVPWPPTGAVCPVSPDLVTPVPVKAESSCSLIAPLLPCPVAQRLHHGRYAPQTALRQSTPQAAERTSMNLAGAALMYAQHRSDLTQAEFPRITQTNYRAISGRQTRHFLTEDRRALVFGKQAVGRVLSRGGNHAFQVRAILSRRTLCREAGTPGA